MDLFGVLRRLTGLSGGNGGTVLKAPALRSGSLPAAANTDRHQLAAALRRALDGIRAVMIDAGHPSHSSGR